MTGSDASNTVQGHAPASHSRFVQRVRRRYAQELASLPQGLPDAAAQQAAFERLRGAGHDSGTALRILRQLVLERLAVLDVERGALLSDVTLCMTALAELALDVACTDTFAALDQRHGEPRVGRGERAGKRAQFLVVGMGKLGARELNVSSDIDLICLYDEDGETDGIGSSDGSRISNHEYFAQAVRAISGLIGDVTEHGFVFRVDLALRPNGNSGPPALSLDALEEYFLAQGREWERFAWLKSRLVAPKALLADAAASAPPSAETTPKMALRRLVTPFVFRRYLDYGVFDALRVLHRQIREHAAKRSAGRPERNNDVKLSRGGIREIEFTVQLLQVVRGGQFPELRTRPTLSALQRLAQAGLMPAETANALAEAYEFLRRVEHRIQYLDDQQTHLLPAGDDDLAWIAASLGFGDAPAFLCQLDACREIVAQEFDKLLGGAGAAKPGCKNCPSAAGGAGNGTFDWERQFDELLARQPPTLSERTATWRAHPRVLTLRESSRERLLRLLGRTTQWLAEGRISEQAACRLLDWLEPLLRRESYFAMLLERPAVHERLLRLLDAARWPARYLLLHPGVIDELADPGMLAERFNPAAFETELETRRAALVASGDGDEEALLNLLRRAHHAEVFRTLTRDVEGALTVEQVADDLSALADTILRVTTRWCWQRLAKKHRTDDEGPQFAIIGYGKLGGKELGYGSDLDIVFVYEDEHEDAPETYALLVRKLINWLTAKTGEGDLYEIDTALRPNGNSGLLITSFTAYANYQQQRGSNTAWTWEHQAMTRARFVLGNPGLQQRFDAVREAVICAPRDAMALRDEIIAMRERVRQAHPVPEGMFDVKHGTGGMVDAEFAVQYLVLSEARNHPALRVNSGNIALLNAAEAAGLLPAGVGTAAANAYRELRRIQHQARLDEAAAQVPPAQAQAERAAILNLWSSLFNS